MAAISCDICGGTLSMDASGDFAVCDSCGMKHTKDRLKTMAQEVTGTVAVSNIASIESLMKRGHLALEENSPYTSHFNKADEYFDKVLDINPDYAPAYIGKLCADLYVKNESLLANRTEPFDNNPNYIKAMRFADEDCRIRLKKYDEAVKQQIEEKKQRIIDNNKRFCNFSTFIESTLKRYPVELLDNGTVNVEGNYQSVSYISPVFYNCFQLSDKKFEFKLRNVIQVASGQHHVILLNSSGEVEAHGNCYIFEYAYSGLNSSCPYKKVGTYLKEITSTPYSYENIVAIAAGSYHTVCLKADGTVESTGLNDNGQCNTGDWSNIIAICAGDKFTIGAKADGTFLAVGEGYNGIFSEKQIIDKFKQEEKQKEQQRQEAEQLKREKEEQRKREEQENKWVSEGLCRYCGGKLGFLNKCKSCGQKN